MGKLTNLQRLLGRVKEDLLLMAGLVEESIHRACELLGSHRLERIQAIIQGDRRIDLMENQVDERIITILATQQPVAGDLRFLAASLKIASNLERIGDQAVNLAQRAQALAQSDPIPTPGRILAMGELAREMTAACLDALVRRDADRARLVLERDDEQDQLCRELLEEMVAWMNAEQRITRRGVEFILASRHLERIGDLACNIAEEVVFLVEGRIIRHL
jgi:phosphate transport system protein